MLSIDFMVELPESSRHDAIMTVMDSVSKRVYFVLTHTMVTAEGAARLFLHYVWKLLRNHSEAITLKLIDSPGS